jgi:predicted O-methyltransferase YrrM
MGMLRQAGGHAFDLLFPAPASGRSGQLRQTMLELEVQKRDSSIEALRRLEETSAAASAWLGLGSIGYEIARHFKPRRVVELGSFGGYSTCAIAMALRDAGSSGRVYAVDTWQGDEHTHQYGESVYQEFLAKRKALGLEHIIEPMRMSFQEASRVIEPGIDLLHIDGWHKFSAVRADFRLFRRHLNRGALVMFHDVNTVFRGMRLFWKLVSAQYPSYLVPYGHGLGIIRVD